MVASNGGHSVQAYKEYWVATMVRGILAMVVGTAILVIPEMASTILLLPFAIVISILCLAAYGTIDSALVFATSFVVPHQQPGRIPLRVQGIIGAVIGVFLFSLVYDRIGMHWFLYLAALQAAAAAIAEFLVARGTAAHHDANWCYASAVIAGLSAIALLMGRDLSPRAMAWLLYGYLGVFGFNLFVLSAHMLFAGRHARQQASA